MKSFATMAAVGLLLAASFPVGVRAQQDSTAPEVAIRNVNIIPMDREVVLDDMTVVVREGKISAVGKAGDIAIPEGAKVVDGRGKYLLPGLMDMHVHVDNDRGLKMYLAHGVTTVRNMAGSPDHLERRRRLNSGELVGPHLYTASPSFDKTDYSSFGVDTTYHAPTPEKAREGIRRFKKDGYDWIKHVRLDKETYEALLDEAKKVGIPVGGHLASLDWPIEELYTAGDVSHEHIKEVYTSKGGTNRTCNLDRIREVARVARSSNLSVSTILHRELVYGEIREQREAYLTSERKAAMLRYVGESAIEDFGKMVEFVRGESDEDRQKVVADDACALNLLKEFYEEGVNIVVGTDSHFYFAFAGISLHDELDLFLEAGLRPYDALRAVTVNAARLLGKEARMGTVATGMDADLILVGGNPLEDVGALRHPEGVMVRGRWFTADRLSEFEGERVDGEL